MTLPFSDLRAFLRDPLSFFTERGRRASAPLARLHMGVSPVFLVTDPELARQIFKAPEEQIDKGRLIYKLRQIMGESSISLSGPLHRQRRGAIHEQVSRGLVTSYVPQISALIRRELSRLAVLGEFDAHHVTAPLALRIISLILFGPNALTQAEENLLIEAVNLVEDDLAASLFKLLPDWPWVHARKKRKLQRGRDMMMFVVEQARRRASNDGLIAGLSKLGLTEKQLGDEILLLFLAGHHTSGTAMAWLLYFLSLDPDLQRQLAAEAAEVADAQGEIIPERLPRGRLALAAGLETLRLYPPAYWMSREVRSPLTLADVSLRKGTSLVVSPWHIHRDPKFWNDPDQFRGARDHLRNPAYMPFGLGPRVCVGMGVAMLELQLLALETAAAFELRVTSPVPAPAPTPRVTIVPPSIRIALSPRASAGTIERRAPDAGETEPSCPFRRANARPAA